MRFKRTVSKNTLFDAPIEKKKDEGNPLLFDTSISFKIVGGGGADEMGDEEKSLVSMSDKVLIDAIIERKDDIEVLISEDVGQKYHKDEFYRFNQMVTDMYAKEFDMSEIMTTIIRELGLKEAEPKRLIGFLMSHHANILRNELSPKVSNRIDGCLF